MAAGAGQSYFGSDHFAEWAPGMKTIDDALEAARTHPVAPSSRPSAPATRSAGRSCGLRRGRGWPDRRGDGGPDRRTRRPHPQGRLPPHRLHEGPGDPARRRSRRAAADGRSWARRPRPGWRNSGVEIQLGAMVTDVDRNGITVKHGDGTIDRIECATKVCGRPASRPARWASRSPTSPAPSWTGPGGSKVLPT